VNVETVPIDDEVGNPSEGAVKILQKLAEKRE